MTKILSNVVHARNPGGLISVKLDSVKITKILLGLGVQSLESNILRALLAAVLLATNSHAVGEAIDSPGTNTASSAHFAVVSGKPVTFQSARDYSLSVFNGRDHVKTIELGRSSSRPPNGFWAPDGSTYWLTSRVKSSNHLELIAYDPNTLSVRQRHDLGPRVQHDPVRKQSVLRIAEDGTRIYALAYVGKSERLRTLDATNLETISEIDIGGGFVDFEELQDHHVALFVSSLTGDRIVYVVDTSKGLIKHSQGIVSREGLSMLRTPDRRYLTITEQMDRAAPGLKKQIRVTVVRTDGTVTSQATIGANLKRLNNTGGHHWFIADADGHAGLWRVDDRGELKQAAVTPEPCNNRNAAVHSAGTKFAVFCRKKLWYWNGDKWSDAPFKAKMDNAILADRALFAMQRKGSNVFRFALSPLSNSHTFATSGSARLVLQPLFGGDRHFLSSMYHDQEGGKLYVVDTRAANIAVLNAADFDLANSFNLSGTPLGITWLQQSPSLFTGATNSFAAIDIESGELSYESTGDFVGIDPANDRFFLKRNDGLDLVNLTSGETLHIPFEREIFNINAPAWGTREEKTAVNRFQYFIY